MRGVIEPIEKILNSNLNAAVSLFCAKNDSPMHRVEFSARQCEFAVNENGHFTLTVETSANLVLGVVKVFEDKGIRDRYFLHELEDYMVPIVAELEF